MSATPGQRNQVRSTSTAHDVRLWSDWIANPATNWLGDPNYDTAYRARWSALQPLDLMTAALRCGALP
jgi:hypothetical protein